MERARASTLALDDDRQPRLGRTRRGPASTTDLDRLIATHGERLARLAFRLLGWRDEVDDVVQDVFVAALRNRTTFRLDSEIATWLTRITINTCRTRLRKKRLTLRGWLHLRERAPRASAATSQPALARREEAEVVRSAVRRLPEKYREAVVLRYLEEMEIAEIAGVLELSRNAVEVRLNRARERLRDTLGDLER